MNILNFLIAIVALIITVVVRRSTKQVGAGSKIMNASINPKSAAAFKDMGPHKSVIY